MPRGKGGQFYDDDDLDDGYDDYDDDYYEEEGYAEADAPAEASCCCFWGPRGRAEPSVGWRQLLGGCSRGLPMRSANAGAPSTC